MKTLFSALIALGFLFGTANASPVEITPAAQIEGCGYGH